MAAGQRIRLAVQTEAVHGIGGPVADSAAPLEQRADFCVEIDLASGRRWQLGRVRREGQSEQERCSAPHGSAR